MCYYCMYLEKFVIMLQILPALSCVLVSGTGLGPPVVPPPGNCQRRQSQLDSGPPEPGT